MFFNEVYRLADVSYELGIHMESLPKLDHKIRDLGKMFEYAYLQVSGEADREMKKRYPVKINRMASERFKMPKVK